MSEADEQPGPGFARDDFGVDAEDRGVFDEAVFDAAVDPGLGHRRVVGIGLIEDLYPGAFLVDGGSGDQLSRAERAARSNETAFLVVCFLLALCAVGASVAGAFGTIWALRDASRSAAFDAAPACAAAVAPVGDCLAWTSQTVTDVHVTRKAGTTVYLGGGQQIWYDGSTAWINSLTPGTTVSVLEWEGDAEALREPGRIAVYSPNSASLAIYGHTSVAVSMFSFAIGLGGALLGLSPLRLSRPRLIVVALLLGLLAPSGFVAGLTIDGAKSFPVGIITGAVVYPSLIAAVFTGIAISRSRRRRAEGRLAHVS